MITKVIPEDDKKSSFRAHLAFIRYMDNERTNYTILKKAIAIVMQDEEEGHEWWTAQVIVSLAGTMKYFKHTSSSPIDKSECI